MSQSTFIGIEIGGTKLQLVAGSALGEINTRLRFAVDRGRGAEGIREKIAEAAPDLAKEHSAVAIGVGFGGPTDWRAGKTILSHHVEGWHDFPLASWLSDMTAGLPVVIDNDANVAGLGEACCGVGRGHHTVFYVTLGSGVGGGLIQGGRILHGGGATETEIGHLRLDRDGTIVESRCSGWAVDRRIREVVTEYPDAELAQRVAASKLPPAVHLAPALAARDHLARRIIEEVGADLGLALSHVTQLLSPNIIVIGGGLSLIGEPLVNAIQTGLDRHVMKALQPAPRVCAAGLGEDPVPVGALLLAAQGHST